MDKVQSLATQEGRSLYQIIRDADRYPALKSAAGKLRTFSDMIEGLRSLEDAMELPEFYDLVCERSGYIRALEEKGNMESRGRIENVQELRSSVMGFLDSDPEDRSLAGFLDTVALYTDLDDAQESDNCVSLMTMHSAKGLEFPTVYVVGMEEGVFPGGRAAGDSEEMEEERRLCYVAMTRARERLVMTTARQRMLYGRTTNNMPSRFLEEIPTENMDWQGKADGRIPRNDWGEDASFGGSGFSGRTFGQQRGGRPPRPGPTAAPPPVPTRRGGAPPPVSPPRRLARERRCSSFRRGTGSATAPSAKAWWSPFVPWAMTPWWRYSSTKRGPSG